MPGFPSNTRRYPWVSVIVTMLVLYILTAVVGNAIDPSAPEWVPTLTCAVVPGALVPVVRIATAGARNRYRDWREVRNGG